MSGAIIPLPNTPSYRGAQFKKKHKHNFTLLYITSNEKWANDREWRIRREVTESCRSFLVARVEENHEKISELSDF
jgi:hypothetical protein